LKGDYDLRIQKIGKRIRFVGCVTAVGCVLSMLLV